MAKRTRRKNFSTSAEALGFPYDIELWRGKGKLWFWRLRAGNDQILATSEGYSRYTDAHAVSSRLCRTLGGRLFKLFGGADSPSFRLLRDYAVSATK